MLILGRHNVAAFFIVSMRPYHNRKWKRTREQILKRDHYLCQQSLRYGKTVQANTVHHIYPLEFYPELQYEHWNLISLSSEEHNKLHHRTGHNLTEEGLKLQKRYKRRYLQWCKKMKKRPHFQY